MDFVSSISLLVSDTEDIFSLINMELNACFGTSCDATRKLHELNCLASNLPGDYILNAFLDSFGFSIKSNFDSFLPIFASLFMKLLSVVIFYYSNLDFGEV